MSEPEIGGKAPELVELEPGDYWWCACGRSQNQPYCDGSHKGTDFVPLQIEIKEKQRMALCTCKRTGNAPNCDGSHANLS